LAPDIKKTGNFRNEILFYKKNNFKFFY